MTKPFEYLSVEVGKGKKGQYFTPRHVIDMCVKMLNPHPRRIRHRHRRRVLRLHRPQHLSRLGERVHRQRPEGLAGGVCREKVFAIDFDPRSIKIAKALNLIAGDGRTNVYRANTLDPRSWSDEVKVGLRDRLRRFPDDPDRTAGTENTSATSTSTCS